MFRRVLITLLPIVLVACNDANFGAGPKSGERDSKVQQDEKIEHQAAARAKRDEKVVAEAEALTAEFTIEPQSLESKKLPVEMLLFLDDSGSNTSNFQIMAEGLEKLTSSLRGQELNANIEVYTVGRRNDSFPYLKHETSQNQEGDVTTQITSASMTSKPLARYDSSNGDTQEFIQTIQDHLARVPTSNQQNSHPMVACSTLAHLSKIKGSDKNLVVLAISDEDIGFGDKMSCKKYSRTKSKKFLTGERVAYLFTVDRDVILEGGRSKVEKMSFPLQFPGVKSCAEITESVFQTRIKSITSSFRWREDSRSTCRKQVNQTHQTGMVEQWAKSWLHADDVAGVATDHESLLYASQLQRVYQRIPRDQIHFASFSITDESQIKNSDQRVGERIEKLGRALSARPSLYPIHDPDRYDKFISGLIEHEKKVRLNSVDMGRIADSLAKDQWVDVTDVVVIRDGKEMQVKDYSFSSRKLVVRGLDKNLNDGAQIRIKYLIRSNKTDDAK